MNFIVEILVLLKKWIKFALWLAFALAEVADPRNADDRSTIVAVFMSFGIASMLISAIIFFVSPEYFQVVAAICLGVYFVSGILFCWFLKSQYGYGIIYIKNK